MEKSTGLSNYFKTVKSKPENDSKPWMAKEVNRLIFLANTSVKNTGDVDLEGIAKHFKRTPGAINVKLSKEGWFKKHGRGQNHQIRKNSLKLDILEYIKTHPHSFCKDIDNALGASTSSTLSNLIKEGKLQRTKHHGDGFYLYSLNEIPIAIVTISEQPNSKLSLWDKYMKFLENLGKTLSDFLRWS